MLNSNVNACLQNCRAEGCSKHSLTGSSLCWDHLEDRDGYLSFLAQKIKNRESLAGFNLKGIRSKELSFLSVDLKEANLSGSDLAGVDFSGADCQGTFFMGANLSNCNFTGAQCRTAQFFMADVSFARFWHAHLEGAQFSEANCERTDFLNASLYQSHFYHANLYRAKFLSRKNFKGPKDLEGLNEHSLVGALNGYILLKKHFMVNASNDDASWASYRECRVKLLLLKKERRIGFFPYLIMGWLCGWGEMPIRAILSAFSIVSFFAVLYWKLDFMVSTRVEDYIPRFLDYFYYSLITFSTVGYGDFIPKPLSDLKILAGIEGFLGVFMGGLFVFTLARRYSAR